MKTFWLILAAGPALSLCAQTNPPPPATAAEPPPPAVSAATATAAPGASAKASPRERTPTEIFSDSGSFNLKTHVAVYTGHVRVLDPQMKLTCSTLTAKVPESGGKIDSIVAEGNVVIDTTDEQGRPIRAKGDKAVYTYTVVNSVTNETVELAGNPYVESAGGSISGETIIWDRANNQFRTVGQHMIIQPEATRPTNAPRNEVATPPGTTTE